MMQTLHVLCSLKALTPNVNQTMRLYRPYEAKSGYEAILRFLERFNFQFCVSTGKVLTRIEKYF